MRIPTLLVFKSAHCWIIRLDLTQQLFFPLLPQRPGCSNLLGEVNSNYFPSICDYQRFAINGSLLCAGEDPIEP